MKKNGALKTLTQLRKPVNTSNSPPEQLSFPGMIHHNATPRKPYLVVRGNDDKGTATYGVSKSRRVLSPGLLLKRFDRIGSLLTNTLGLTETQAEVVQRLLRLWAYYGLVYPKAGQIAGEPTNEDIILCVKNGRDPATLPGSYGCSRSTFWRTIRILQERGLIKVINRYVLREHAQISNIYRLDNLIVVIARYLAEHGERGIPRFLRNYLLMPAAVFYRLQWAAQDIRPPRSPGTYIASYTDRGLLSAARA